MIDDAMIRRLSPRLAAGDRKIIEIRRSAWWPYMLRGGPRQAPIVVKPDCYWNVSEPDSHWGSYVVLPQG